MTARSRRAPSNVIQFPAPHRQADVDRVRITAMVEKVAAKWNDPKFRASPMDAAVEQEIALVQRLEALVARLRERATERHMEQVTLDNLKDANAALDRGAKVHPRNLFPVGQHPRHDQVRPTKGGAA